MKKLSLLVLTLFISMACTNRDDDRAGAPANDTTTTNTGTTTGGTP